MSIVQVIDIGGDTRRVAAELDVVCRRVGFFQITGHGVDESVVAGAWAAATTFFDLPLEQRLDAERPWPGYPYGYVPLSGETLSRSLVDDLSVDATEDAAPDLKEVLNIGPIRPPSHQLADDVERLMFAPSLWPSAMPKLRPAMEAYFDEMLALGRRLLRLLATALDVPNNFFAATIDRTPSSMRAINYPEQSMPPLPGQLRAGAHTDYGTFTMLRQDDAPGGLEVLDPQRQQWVAVPSVEDAFVINVGDMLARWTNDRWRSTMHRVVNPPASGRTRRQSIAFFHNANYDCEVVCLPSCSSADNPPRYEPVLAGPHLMAKFARTVDGRDDS